MNALMCSDDSKLTYTDIISGDGGTKLMATFLLGSKYKTETFLMIFKN